MAVAAPQGAGTELGLQAALQGFRRVSRDLAIWYSQLTWVAATFPDPMAGEGGVGGRSGTTLR